MKKAITLLLTLLLSLSLFACGSNTDDNGTADSNNTTTAEDSKDENTAGDSEEKIEKSIDAVADYLGLEKGEETLYSSIGAKSGREYNNGEIELYEFDKDSAEYETIVEGNGSVKAEAYNDGIVMVVTKEQNQDLIQKFKNIKFK